MRTMLDDYYAEGCGVPDYNGRVCEVPVWDPYTWSTAPAFTANAAAFGGGYWQTATVGQGQYLIYRRYMEPGNWRCSLLYGKSATNAIIHLTVNSTLIGTIDGYVGSGAPFNIVSAFPDFAVVNGGNIQLTFAANTRNGSATNWNMRIQAINLRWIS